MILILFPLFYHGLFAVKHSLMHSVTGSSGDPNISEFTGVVLVDGTEAVYCDSRNKILEPRQEWMKKIFSNDSQHLASYMQQCFEDQPDIFRFLISTLMQLFNQILLLSAAIIKQEWDTDRAVIKEIESLLTKFCPEWLKRYLNYGSSFLQRTVLPSVSLLQKTPSSPVSCHATGFYPDRAVMFWRKDGEEIHEGVDHREILPNNDETFQITVNLNVSSVRPEDWKKYDCVFQLSGVENNIVTKLDKTVIRTNWHENNGMELLSIIVVVVPVLIAVAAVGFVVYKKKKDTEPRLNSEWLQQIPGTTSEISVQKSAVLGTAKILRRTLKLPGLW
ncbi:histone H2B [Sarotherodon galilaeus]